MPCFLDDGISPIYLSCDVCVRFGDISQYLKRATCSPLTINRIEKGSPTVSIGIYARVLYVLQLDDNLLLIAKEDTIGRNLQDLKLQKLQQES